MIAIFASGLALLIMWVVAGKNAATGELIVMSCASIAIICTYPFLWIRNVMIAPALIDGIQSGKIKDLSKQLKPRISISGPFAWTEPKNCQNMHAYRVYRVKVTNDSNTLIQNCSVKLINMVNVENRPTRNSGQAFKMASENSDDLSHRYKQKFNISPGDSEDVEIAGFIEEGALEENDVKPSPIVMFYAQQGNMDRTRNVVPIEMCPHELTIRAVAENTPPVEMRLKYWVDDAGFFRMGSI